mmetsp:Transcript_27998/g.65734  ORF Transcript_27998/g.65734 Transcript_27998/m.65734 type:complete len:106 (-) Transcript_27998:704-1021(-)
MMDWNAEAVRWKFPSLSTSARAVWALVEDEAAMAVWERGVVLAIVVVGGIRNRVDVAVDVDVRVVLLRLSPEIPLHEIRILSVLVVALDDLVDLVAVVPVQPARR